VKLLKIAAATVLVALLVYYSDLISLFMVWTVAWLADTTHP